MSDKEYTRAQVATHNTPDDAWIIVDSVVYDVTSFAKYHPGGKGVLLEYAGKDATQAFYDMHSIAVIAKYKPRLSIGTIKGKKPTVEYQLEPGFISNVPYAESSYFQGFKSAYYTESHHRFKVAVRTFLQKDIMPLVKDLEEAGKAPPKKVWQMMGQCGYLASRIGPGLHLQGRPMLGDISPEEFDYFHELIAHEESARLGSPSITDGIGAGMVISLPTIIQFGTPLLKKTIVPQVLDGEKQICLAISEPFAGSDVANIKCTARKTPDGKHYIVNGVKKWITNGTFCDYFITAVRTGGEGIGGVSLLLVERSAGLDTKLIKTSYGGAAGTAYVTYEDVKVPVENLLGTENQGFKCIMANFNHERWLIVAASIMGSRFALEDCFKWAHQRCVFGKPLAHQPVIRNKLAQMVAELESVNHWLENITFQMNQMSYKEQSMRLAGPIALLKLQATRVALRIADNACQIFGGRAITRTGMGYRIERLQRSIKYAAILGGSEEIMGDLGIKQAMKQFPEHARL